MLTAADFAADAGDVAFALHRSDGGASVLLALVCPAGWRGRAVANGNIMIPAPFGVGEG